MFISTKGALGRPFWPMMTIPSIHSIWHLTLQKAQLTKWEKKQKDEMRKRQKEKRTIWISHQCHLFTRPFPQKGSSLTEELLSVRLSVITFSFSEYWTIILPKPSKWGISDKSFQNAVQKCLFQAASALQSKVMAQTWFGQLRPMYSALWLYGSLKHLSSVIDHLLMRKERRLEKSTLPPVLTVVTIMSYASVFYSGCKPHQKNCLFTVQ